ncbi:MAG: polyprenyl synthetase family protein [Chloroflexi bacterium]|nr:polyprenyl synthetase family protein [Chloroflexota bacterium]
MSIASTVDLVAAEMAQVEARLAGVASVEYPLLGELLKHLLDTRGKRLRPLVLILSARLFREASPAVVDAAAAIELLHTATLVHDDLVDRSTVRRGRPTLNSLKSGGVTVLVGDYMFAQAAGLAAATRNPDVVSVFARSLRVICEGELRQIDTRGDWRQSLDDYYYKIGCKTAALFAAAAEIGAILGRASKSERQRLHDFGYDLGLAFQIVDDLLDFVGDERELGKPVGSDLRQGTLTLPVLHLLRSDPESPAIRAVVDLDGDDGRDEAIEAAVDTVVASGAIQSAHSEAVERVGLAKSRLDDYPPTPIRAALLELADYVTARRF